MSTKANERISIFVVDGNFSNIHPVAANPSVNAKIEFAINLSTFGLQPGHHSFTVGAVDTGGTFSNGELFDSTFGVTPTTTPAPTTTTPLTDRDDCTDPPRRHRLPRVERLPRPPPSRHHPP
jgi:hypothetical protein